MFTDLLTNFFSFISNSYKLDPIRTLLDRATLGWVFTTTSRNLPKSFIRILFPVHLVENVINCYFTFTRQDCNPPASVSDNNLPFTLNYLTLVLSPLSRRKTLAILLNAIIITYNGYKVSFLIIKIGNMFSMQDPIPCGLRVGVVYKFFVCGLWCLLCPRNYPAFFHARTWAHFHSVIGPHIF